MMDRRLAAAGRLLGGGVAILLFLSAPGARAEKAWVGGNVRLNLRAGPGTQYRILNVAQTGDSVEVMERGDGWTRVSIASGEQGWIPAGYLAPQPPARVRLRRLESELEGLRAKLTSLSEEAEHLRTDNSQLTERDAEQRANIQSLTEENLDLKAGERWPYLIAGASILASGMLLGALLHASSTRRRQQRIRF